MTASRRVTLDPRMRRTQLSENQSLKLFCVTRLIFPAIQSDFDISKELREFFILKNNGVAGKTRRASHYDTSFLNVITASRVSFSKHV